MIDTMAYFLSAVTVTHALSVRDRRA